MSISAGVSSLFFADGSMEAIPENGITVIVGPNNSGKSLCLNNIAELLQNDRYTVNGPRVLDNLELQKSSLSTNSEITDWLEASGWKPLDASEGRKRYGANENGESGIEDNTILNAWLNGPRLSQIFRFFVEYQKTDQRLNLVQPAQMVDPLRAAPSSPVQFVAYDPQARSRLSRLTRLAFGQDVCVNTFIPRLDLRLGEVRPYLENGNVPYEIHEEYARLPLVSEQGDGIRSFVGLILNTVIQNKLITLIDEPEAFLHPPQARRLGRILVTETPEQSQVIVATHSQDFLQGVLEGTQKSVKIIRLDRDSNHNFKRSSLAPERIREIWKNPLLKYSNIIDGLFHSGVIITEGDTDCRFYSAVLDEMFADKYDLDLLMTHLNGKARLKKGISEMRALGVPVGVIADLDLLDSRYVLTGVLEAAGGSWDSIESDFGIVQAAVSELHPEAPHFLKLKEAVGLIEENLVERDFPLSGSQVDAVKESVKGVVAWRLIKKKGLSCLNADAQEAGLRVLEELSGFGIFVVPVGELESWVSLNVSKQNWLTKVFEDGLHLSASSELKSFLSSVVKFYGK